MTIVGRSLVRSVGYIGSPGYNVLHWTAGLGPGPSDEGGVEEFHDSLQAAYDVWATACNPQVTFEVLPEVTYFDDEDGVLAGVTIDPTGVRTIVSTGSGFGSSRATAMCLRLFTGTIVNGRRLQGRIFIGPAAASALDSNGQIASGVIPGIESGASGLFTGLGGILCVWHRPVGDPPAGGTYGDVMGVSCNQTPGTIRSRKT